MPTNFCIDRRLSHLVSWFQHIARSVLRSHSKISSTSTAFWDGSFSINECKIGTPIFSHSRGRRHKANPYLVILGADDISPTHNLVWKCIEEKKLTLFFFQLQKKVEFERNFDFKRGVKLVWNESIHENYLRVKIMTRTVSLLTPAPVLTYCFFHIPMIPKSRFSHLTAKTSR